jgi:hypothetical protein
VQLFMLLQVRALKIGALKQLLQSEKRPRRTRPLLTVDLLEGEAGRSVVAAFVARRPWSFPDRSASGDNRLRRTLLIARGVREWLAEPDEDLATLPARGVRRATGGLRGC